MIKLLVTEAPRKSVSRRIAASVTQSMRPIRLHPPFDHGAALRVPPPSDQAGWRTLWTWLGEAAHAVIEGAAVQVRTPEGPVVARCGDWIVLSHSGDFHVARTSRTADA